MSNVPTDRAPGVAPPPAALDRQDERLQADTGLGGTAAALQTTRAIRVGEAHPSRRESGESAGAWAGAAGVAAVAPQPRGGSPAQRRVAACAAPAGRRRHESPRPPQ